jgi:acetylornithine/succinyldiaminopimelate/putrescine aminotransferase
MAKSLGGGFPIGAFWLREPHGDLLSAGTHGTTYGGNPLGCAVALKILEVVQRDHLAENARQLGAWLKSQLETLAAEFPQIITNVRGVGFMLGFELTSNAPGLDPAKPASLQFVNKLHERGLLTIPSGTQVIRLLPALNLTCADAEQGIAIIAKLVRELAAR